MEYTVENITASHIIDLAGEAEQTDDLFSEQNWSYTAEGEPGEENGTNEPGTQVRTRVGIYRECTVKYTPCLEVISKELNLSIPSFIMIYCIVFK